MMNNMQISASLLGVVAVAAIVQPAYAQLSGQQIGAIAKSITVLLEMPGSNGSGVLIRRDGDVYTVLTAYHVVKSTNPSEEAYVTTFDKNKQKHRLDSSSIRQLGKWDLAIVQFRSTNDYQVAKIGDSRSLQFGTDVYVSGFPLPTSTFPKSSLAFLSGQVVSILDEPNSGGYQIAYDNKTLTGISGGAVLNANGELVAIHGLTEGEVVMNNVAKTSGRNLGVPSALFISLIENISTLPVAAQLNPPPFPVKPEQPAPPPIEEKKREPRELQKLDLPTTDKSPTTKPTTYVSRLADIAEDKSPTTKPTTYVSRLADIAENKSPTTKPTTYVSRLADIAERITVYLECPGLSGSGVIIKRSGESGDLYTILTTYHVVKDTEPQEGAYVTTFDKKRHQLDSRSIRRLGNLDLAIIDFRSSNNYQVAKIGDSDRLRTGMDIYVSGFLNATETLAGGDFAFLRGLVVSRLPEPNKEGYQIVYDNNTKSGISGGSVLNDNGELVGIHGLSEGERVGNSPTPVKTGRNLGIPSNLFVSFLDNLVGSSRVNQDSTISTLKVSLWCETLNGFPTTVLVSRKYNTPIQLIRWTSSGNFSSPEERCNKVSSRFQQAIDAGMLVHIIAKKKDENVSSICASTERYSSVCTFELFEVPSYRDPELIIQQMQDINIGKRTLPIIF